MEPEVTIIVTQRERTSLSGRSLESLLADRSQPFRLIYVDGGAPESVRTYLERRAAEADFTLIRRPHFLWPNAARNLALPFVDTRYVVFIDNDVLVEPGWLKKLVDCAKETGAALVGPLYLWSDGVGDARIHMAGGTLTRVETPKGPALHERHEDINAALSERSRMTRGTCDFLEYHCMLARTDFVRRQRGLSEDIVCLHEHIDIALEAKQENLGVWIEPAAAATYLAFAPFRLADLAFFRWRWNDAATDASLRAFSRKWDLVPDDDALAGARDFAASHLAEIDPIVPRLASACPTAPLAAAGVRQNLYGLLTQAAAMGYAKADLERFASAYQAAMSLFAGGFRPCARPFIAHCTGTASALVAFGFAPHIVVGGMLHAAYSHAPLGPQPLAALSDLQRQLQTTFGERTERLIRNYARLQTNPRAWCATHPLEALTLDETEVIAVGIANQIDECAAGEPVFSAKPPASADWIAYVRAVAVALGVPAFAETLARLAEQGAPPGFDMKRPHGESFRFTKGGVAPMAHGAFRAWDEAQSQTPLAKLTA